MNHELYTFVRNATTEELISLAMHYISDFPHDAMTHIRKESDVVLDNRTVPSLGPMVIRVQKHDMKALQRAYEAPHTPGWGCQPDRSKIGAIKEFRNMWGVGLKEAKDCVEHMITVGHLN